MSGNLFREIICLSDQGKLKRFAIDKNMLTVVSLTGLYSLIHVSLANNGLKTVPDLAGCPNCQFINLRGNLLRCKIIFFTIEIFFSDL